MSSLGLNPAYSARTVQQSPYCHLSVELVQQVASYFDLNSIKALRSTCHFASCASDCNFVNHPRSLRIEGSHERFTRALELTNDISSAYRSVSFVPAGSADGVSYDRDDDAKAPLVKLPKQADILAVLAACQ